MESQDNKKRPYSPPILTKLKTNDKDKKSVGLVA